MKYFFLFFLPFFLNAAPAPKGREPSAPFISGDTFRFFADFVFDEVDTGIDPKQVQSGNTIFVKTDYLGRFFKDVHPKIEHPYLIISHNSDDSAPGCYASFLNDPKLLGWFAQNYDGYPHPKIHPIPIGIANFHWPHGNFHAILEVQKKDLLKKHLAYLNIAIQTFPQERQILYTLLKAKNFCFQGSGKKYGQFLEDLKASKFVMAPRGNGLDTHRLWETLLIGSIPVVKTSSLDPLYEGLPVVIVQNWQEVTEEFLKKKSTEMQAKTYFPERLYIDYWLQKIHLIARSVKEDKASADK